MTNIKLIYIKDINDDYFLVYCIIVTMVTGLIGTIFWGILGDARGIAYSMLYFTMIDFLFKLFN